MPRSPFKEFEELLEEMDERFSRARVGLGGEIATAAVDVSEWDGDIVVTADLPGFEKEDIDIRVTDNTLHIDAEHTAEEEREEEHYIHSERVKTDVSRTIPLPEEVEESEASATYENGVLTVTLPKKHAESEDSGHHVPLS
ncbi:archaeal heat shock protein Hsp14 [Halarchaeum sp. P4]|uniref:archaeal heat shock protein Hsp14 n=1 Tax=Halarchaeum sp. P4 TaxID=3421639 RepID=UPI003EBDC6F5